MYSASRIKGTPQLFFLKEMGFLFSGSRQVNVRQSAELPMSQILLYLIGFFLKDGHHCRLSLACPELVSHLILFWST